MSRQITLAGIRHFAILHGTGGMMRPPRIWIHHIYYTYAGQTTTFRGTPRRTADREVAVSRMRS